MQFALDTETTGLEVNQGHRLIELALVELGDRRCTGREWRWRFNPEREIDPEAMAVHGISNEELRDQARFCDVASEILGIVDGHELIIHNAAFDVGFINAELARMRGEARRIADFARIVDSLKMARERHPGQRNTLDALCKRYEIDATDRTRHGALVDSRLLAMVYLAMTAGQSSFELTVLQTSAQRIARRDVDLSKLRVQRAQPDELAQHALRLQQLDQASKGQCLWRQLEARAAELG